MPALIAHHTHGQDVLAAWQPPAAWTAQDEAVFLLGCQGPDPYFFTIFDLQMAKHKQFGSVQHKEQVQQNFDCLRKNIELMPTERQTTLEAYVRGWLCHFTLDSQAHPYVFSFEQALCAAGVPGLDADAHSVVHSQIESDLDCSMLFRRTGKTIKDYRPMDEIPVVDDTNLYWIGVLYRQVAKEVFNTTISEQIFTRAVKDMRTTYNTLYSAHGYKRNMIGNIERLFRPHSLAQATAHRSDVGDVSWFDNPKHEVWINPFTKESATSSFQEIFDRAVTIGLQRQQLYSAKVNSPELIGVLNFEGKDIMPKDIKSSFSALGDISKGILQNRAASADAGQ